MVVVGGNINKPDASEREQSSFQFRTVPLGVNVLKFCFLSGGLFSLLFPRMACEVEDGGGRGLQASSRERGGASPVCGPLGLSVWPQSALCQGALLGHLVNVPESMEDRHSHLPCGFQPT